MNNVVLARIFDSVTSEFTLGQISKILNMSVDEILDSLEELVGKEIAPNLNYLMRNERTLSEEQFKRLDQIRLKSVYNKVYQHTAMMKFFPSAYEALNFYVTNNRGSKDVWAFQYDSDLFDENSDYYSLSV